jgi:hypothetical protein
MVTEYGNILNKASNLFFVILIKSSQREDDNVP